MAAPTDLIESGTDITDEVHLVGVATRSLDRGDAVDSCGAWAAYVTRSVALARRSRPDVHGVKSATTSSGRLVTHSG
jgi:hypothetical protein